MIDVDDDWILPTGERLEERRAQIIRARFGREAWRLGRELAERLRDEQPELDVHRRVFGVGALLQANPFPQRPEQWALWIGHVFHPSPAGQPKTYRIRLNWESGRLNVRE